jgi:hypothetical protein
MKALRRHTGPQTLARGEPDSSRHFVGAQRDRADPFDHGKNLLFNFPASLRDARNWRHLGDVAISADVRFAPILLKKAAA